MSSILWYLRGFLCPVLGHKVVDTDPAWADELGPRICAYCYAGDR